MIRRYLQRIMPKSLTGQVLLALAGALLLAQTISAVLLYKAQAEYREEQLTHALALRTSMAIHHTDDDGPPRPFMRQPFLPHPMPPRAHLDASGPPSAGEDMGHDPRMETVAHFTPLPVDHVKPELTSGLNHILTEQDMAPVALIVVQRPLEADAMWAKHVGHRFAALGKHRPPWPDSLLVAAVQMKAGGPWLVTRISMPPRDPWLLATLILQTLIIYALLVGAMALILRRIARPLAALTTRVGHFAETREAEGQIAPEGPDDVRHLIEAHNAMEQGIIALINEKDVMLGAIGHDLKTPLAALRVRIECVDDDAERDKMAKTIEDIVRSLDDILSLARVGRPTDPVEPTELSALVASIVEEYEDMGDEVILEDTRRLVLPLRATWMRRALRNLIGNALRYAGSATVSMAREQAEGRDWAVIRVVDGGRGIPEGQIERMFQPFTRGEPSRNTGTGGAGLGLTLARAIADQHGGRLLLANRMDEAGAVVGLTATLWLPLPS